MNRVLSLYMLRLMLLVSLSGVVLACAVKPVTVVTSMNADAVYQLAIDTTPKICGYKGSITAKLEGSDSASVRGLLDKQCNGDFTLVVLGAFNRPAAEIKYISSEITVSSSEQSLIPTIKHIADTYARTLTSVINSPLQIPFDNIEPRVAIDYDKYILDFKKLLQVSIDKDYYFVGYDFQDTSINYSWQKNKIYNIILDKEREKLTITFHNADGWR